MLKTKVVMENIHHLFFAAWRLSHDLEDACEPWVRNVYQAMYGEDDSEDTSDKFYCEDYPDSQPRANLSLATIDEDGDITVIIVREWHYQEDDKDLRKGEYNWGYKVSVGLDDDYFFVEAPHWVTGYNYRLLRKEVRRG